MVLLWKIRRRVSTNMSLKTYLKHTSENPDDAGTENLQITNVDRFIKMFKKIKYTKKIWEENVLSLN